MVHKRSISPEAVQLEVCESTQTACLSHSPVDDRILSILEMVSHEIAGINHLVQSIVEIAHYIVVGCVRVTVLVDFEAENMIILVAGTIIDII